MGKKLKGLGGNLNNNAVMLKLKLFGKLLQLHQGNFNFKSVVI